MYWSRDVFNKWVEKEDNPYYPPNKRSHVDSGFGVDGGPRYVYNPEYAAIVDDSMLVEVDDGTRTFSIEEEKAWYFRDVHWDIVGPVSLKIVECGKYLVNQMEYLHVKRRYPHWIMQRRWPTPYHRKCSVINGIRMCYVLKIG